MANVIKDIGEIWTRLFDHRPFLNGEIKFFIREFEEKRSDREIEGLFQILENVTEIRDTQIDRVKLAADTHLPSLKLNIDRCLLKCDAILDKEKVYRADTTLEKKRALRKAEWESFIQDITKKCEKVDETFREKEDDIRDFYYNIEKKLNISPTHSNKNNITCIKDPSVSVKPTPNLINYLQEHRIEIANFKQTAPETIIKLTKNPKNKNISLKLSDVLWVDSFLKHNNKVVNLLQGDELDSEIDKFLKNNQQSDDKSDGTVKNVYLHELLDLSELILPRNEVIERNPVLEARIQKLQKEQEEREYKAMTRNVDMAKKFMVEDTLAYQMNMMNRHLIAVGQFLLSVAAGFAFGFLGVELIIGDMEFGFRLLLGIICALIVALAEFYFLAKHLVLEDEIEDQKLSGTEIPPVFKFSTAANGEKPHKD